MNRNNMARHKSFPGTRLFLYFTSIMGVARTAEELLNQVGASSEPIDPTTHAEGSDINSKAIWIAGIGVLLGLWAIVVALYPLFTYFKYERTGGKDPAKVLVWAPPLPPLPQNINHPFQNLQEFRARENFRLNTYQWVDRGKGIVSIPIARAIQIVAQRGVPPSPPGGTAYYPPKAGNMQTGFQGKVEPEPR